MENSAAICDFPPEKRALLHEILERVADKWTLLVIEALDGEREVRFSDLQRRVGSVSHKMLTESLGESGCGICTWVGEHMAKVERARRAYDGKSDPSN